MESLNTKLNKAARTVFRKNKESIDDIILFGSYMKGKDAPKDIDLLIIFKETIQKSVESNLRKEIDMEDAEINSITIKELEDEGFIAKEGVYLEGFSLITKKMLNAKLGFSSVAFIKYDLSKIKGSKRILFYYALQGRNTKKGFLASVGAKRFSESVIVSDYLIIEKIKPFFEQWDIDCQIIPALVPLRLKKIILG